MDCWFLLNSLLGRVNEIILFSIFSSLSPSSNSHLMTLSVLQAPAEYQTLQHWADHTLILPTRQAFLDSHAAHTALRPSGCPEPRGRPTHPFALPHSLHSRPSFLGASQLPPQSPHGCPRGHAEE